MKTQKHALTFNKYAVAELNENQLAKVNGGTGSTTTIGTTSLLTLTLTKEVLK